MRPRKAPRPRLSRCHTGTRTCCHAHLHTPHPRGDMCPVSAGCSGISPPSHQTSRRPRQRRECSYRTRHPLRSAQPVLHSAWQLHPAWSCTWGRLACTCIGRVIRSQQLFKEGHDFSKDAEECPPVCSVPGPGLGQAMDSVAAWQHGLACIDTACDTGHPSGRACTCPGLEVTDRLLV